jgi:hypothetical protein
MLIGAESERLERKSTGKFNRFFKKMNKNSPVES